MPGSAPASPAWPPAPNGPTASTWPGATSYSERYRGTEWGGPADPPAVLVEAPSASRGSPLALVLIGVALLVVSIGSIFVLARPSSPAPVAAFASRSPAESGTPLATPSPRPSGSAGPSVPSPAPAVPSAVPTEALPTDEPSPTRRPPPDGSVASRFAWQVSDPEVSFHVHIEGDFHVGNEAGRMEYDFDIGSGDVAGRMTITQGRVTVAADFVAKDGVGYVRPAGEAWIRDDSGWSTGLAAGLFGGSGDPLDGLVYVGTVRLGGQTLHHLRLPRIDWHMIGSAMLDANEGGVTIREMHCDVYVTDAGVPHSTRITFDGTSTDGGLVVEMAFTLDYRFSRFGKPVTITAPDVPPDGSG